MSRAETFVWGPQASSWPDMGLLKNIETHCRDIVILPLMVGTTIKVHRGNRFEPVIITEEMVGHYIGEFTLTRVKVSHSSPGIGATKSSSSLSVK